MTVAHEDAAGPGLEAIGIAQAGQVLPGRQQRLLGGVPGKIAIAQDAEGDGMQTPADGVDDAGEGLAIPLLRPDDQTAVHALARSRRSSAASTWYVAVATRRFHLRAAVASCGSAQEGVPATVADGVQRRADRRA